jgi:hypothetical protein
MMLIEGILHLVGIGFLLIVMPICWIIKNYKNKKYGHRN